MSDRKRNLFMIGLAIFITLGIFFFGRFLTSDDLNADQNPIRITRTATVETIQPTATNTLQGELVVTNSFTPIPYNADMSPTALPPPTHQTRTVTPTLCPPSDVVCPGGNATLNPQQQVFQLMASAEGTEYAQLALTATALATSPTPTEHVTAVSITATQTSSYQQTSCAFSWAHQAVPEAATALQNAFNDAGVKSIGVLQVDAFGENCTSADGKNSHFGAMSSDFYLSATVNNLNDANEMAQIITIAYKTISALKVKLPAGPGYIDIMITANGSTKHYRAQFSDLRSAIEAGKDGKTLLEMGGLR